MKVLCIDDSDNEAGMKPEVVCGETYTATGTVTGVTGVVHYNLLETEHAYGVHRFSPTSTIDERELLEQRQTQHV